MVFNSPLPDVKIEDGSLTDYVCANHDQFADFTAFVDEDGNSYTFAQFQKAFRTVSAGLTAAGFKQGDVCLILSYNHLQFPVAFHAVSVLGGVVTTCNPAYTENEISHQLRDSAATFAFVCGPCVATLQRAVEICPGVKRVWVWDEEGMDLQKRTSEIQLFSDLLDFQTEDLLSPRALESKVIESSDLCALPYSSGTTGLSKGVMLSHGNIVANLCQIHGLFAFHKGMTVMAVLPFYHIYGLVVVMNHSLRHGSTVVIMRRFNPTSFLQLIQTHRISWLPIVPPLVLFLSKSPLVDDYDLSSVTTILCGAAPLGHELAAACVARLNHVDLRQGYGMTELSPVSHGSPERHSKFAAAGILLPNTQARIVDPETDTDVTEPGNRGELWVKGPQVMQGYLRNEAATARTITADGWLRTGDICEVDAEHYFFVVDRLKELIKFKGFQVPPAELEAILVSHPAVADCAVIGSPSSSAGELPKAFVVRAPGTSVTAGELKDFVKARVSYYKQLRGGVEFVDMIPKSASGKILRRLLRDQDLARAKQQREEEEEHKQDRAGDRQNKDLELFSYLDYLAYGVAAVSVFAFVAYLRR
mmetsp:Transcript_31458/g.61350  ORF Transcript_31458/g.61350 Transcript_31458/m.61350 type:complete len:588 (+) Transcript_31458:38-1801(+)|eukprot:CAMPEP_0175131372 /NCGR_PEP_ID=MMETSP0087-20121206/6506_1 /TAXON_ID=136419 /ORGANISM="Unknown Unknown, Strain D1" /LENGTH=587 /DNA_ID=CAMNT_0016413655 /DNA_START=38 /DNA_END=1801 /DNA_ORIENTATION=+